MVVVVLEAENFRQATPMKIFHLHISKILSNIFFLKKDQRENEKEAKCK